MNGKALDYKKLIRNGASAMKNVHRGSVLHRPFSIPARVSMQATLGFALGFLLLHPISMIIFMVLNARMGDSLRPSAYDAYLSPFLHSFSLQMMPMGLVFGFIGAVIASLYGYQGATIACQRDALLRQLELNRHYRMMLMRQRDLLKRNNRRLAELERSNRRTALFMVHDFKTHLGCILGYSRELMVIEHGKDIPEASEASMMLFRIWRQALKMLSSVHDLLDFARLTERPEIRKERIELVALLHEVAADFNFYASQEGAEISTSVQGDGDSRLVTDRRLLRRILGNLVFNGLSHGKRGGAIRLEAASLEGANEVIISCRNEGRGALPQSLDALFRDFSTGSDAYSGSSGLGLAFCKTAVESLGGRIWVEKTEPSETCFSISLPQSLGEIP